MATLFMVDGFGARGALPLLQIVKDWQTANPGGRLVQVDYNNQTSDISVVNAGADALQAALINPAYTTPFTVVTISMGGSVASMLLRRWYALPGHVGPISPANVRFWLIANPERRHNGAATLGATVFGSNLVVRYANPPGVPTDIPYTIVDITQQYDPIGDWPDQPNITSNLLTNLMVGLFLVHNFYFAVTLNADTNTSWTEGNITYTVVPTVPTKLAQFFWYSPALVISQDAIYRAEFEPSYTRHDGTGAPAPLPPVVIVPPPIGFVPPEIPVSATAVDRRIYEEAA